MMKKTDTPGRGATTDNRPSLPVAGSRLL